ncbi:hypothetical protein C8R43DRAFT_891527 [Mycena crocata]|nr:hypothetical protein C8R43DRAFT_891527 [Mycena crocata]
MNIHPIGSEFDGDPVPNPFQLLPVFQNHGSTPSSPPLTPSATKTYAEQRVQAGAEYTQESLEDAYYDLFKTQDARFDHVLKGMQKGGWTLGSFLQKLFAIPRDHELSRSQKHAQMVSGFLGCRDYEKFKPDHIVELMYANKDSAPKETRNKPGVPIVEKERRDATLMGRHLLSEWAIQKVEGFVSAQSEEISGKEGGFHLTAKETTWDFIHGFSLAKAIVPIEKKGTVLLRMLAAAALPAALSEAMRPSEQNPTPYSIHLSRPLHSGSGGNRKDPLIIIVVACLMLMYARNLHFSLLRKISGIWLFANNASASIFSVLSRIGLSSSYTTVLKTLRTLSTSAQSIIREKAQQRAFLLIYDNINRMSRAWDPDLGQRDMMNNGTAATFIELMNCDVGKAFDPQALKAARDAGLRAQLTTKPLYDRIDAPELNAVMGLHCLSFLTSETPILAPHQVYINLRFRTAHAKHRMPDNHITVMHPLATSTHDEGTTPGSRDVLDDLVLRQLGMEKNEVDKLLIIVGGDQSTVKLRNLQKFLADCPHGYARYGWVLPLIQLWHMGWADLERVLNTHWGRTASNSETGDMSSFYFTNTILKRKIKDVKRPDYYPTQNFVFDTLKAKIIDCWKVHLGTDDLNTYFTTNTYQIEELLRLGQEIVELYLTIDASEKAREGFQGHKFKTGDAWSRPAPSADAMDVDDPADRYLGDAVLANVILRLRDSMLHYEFQHAVSDGDIGRAMNVMAVWTFTFTGCGKNKYLNELLEISCNFLYEYSPDLRRTQLNNWLCTFTEHGCWFPMDLLQEKNIKLLKKLSQRRDSSFGAAFYQEIISYNIRALSKSSETMQSAVGISRTGGRHRRAKKEAAMKELGTAMSERQLHKFRAGRDFGHRANDDFEAGYLKLSKGKVKDFIKRTIADAGNLHGDDDGVDESHSPAQVPFPNVVINGVLHCGGDSGSEMSSGLESDAE